MIPIAVCGMSLCATRTVALAIPYGKFDRASYGNRRQKSNYIQDTEVLFCFIYLGFEPRIIDKEPSL